MLQRNFLQSSVRHIYRLGPIVVRHLQTSAVKFHGRYEWEDPKSPDDVVKDRQKVVVAGKVGDNIMYLAHRHAIEIEGACEASLACSTCHVYVKDEFLDKFPEPKDEENDMLDMAPFLRPNSRLSCQLYLRRELDGLEIELPPATRNFYVDGHKPEPH